MKHVIFVKGLPRAGKDTSIAMMRMMLDVPTFHFSGIDPVRSMLSEHVDLSQKTEADRKLLAVVGDAMQEHSKFRTEAAVEFVAGVMEANTEFVIFIQFRESELIRIVSAALGIVGVPSSTLMVRSAQRAVHANNAADLGADAGPYNYLIENSGDKIRLMRSCADFLARVVVGDEL